MTQKPLFDKPLSKLCEIFLRARFAEPNCFGRPDIEEWLEGEHDLKVPGYDPHPWFNERLYRRISCDEGLLERAATSEGVVPYDGVSHLYTFLRMFYDAGGRFYSPIESSCDRVIVFGKKLMAIRLERNDELRLSGKKVDGNIIARVLLREVLGGWPKRRIALEVLRIAYGSAIQSVRRQAVKDFLTAVAVSADGTKIVHADYVCVVSGGDDGPKLALYNAEELYMYKALRHDMMARHDAPPRLDRTPLEAASSLLEDALPHVRRGGVLYELLEEVRGKRNERILFIDESLCQPEALTKEFV